MNQLLTAIATSEKPAARLKRTSYTHTATCQNCGQFFNTSRRHTKTCSPACRQRLARLTRATAKPTHTAE
jgi:hypothetical protein